MSKSESPMAADAAVVRSTDKIQSMAALFNVLSQLKTVDFNDVEVVRQGTQIILPDGMSYADAHLWLKRKEDAEEKVVSVRAEINCYPLDGALALSKALQIIYGFTNLLGKPTFFGEKPPAIIQVPTGVHTTAPAVLGRIQPPTFEGGYLEPVVQNAHTFIIAGEVKRKFEKDTEKIFALTRQVLQDQSIYKGQAVMLDLSYMHPDNGRAFDPTKDAPKFMDLSGVNENKLILNKTTKFSLTTSIYTLLERAEACKANNIPLKHGALFMGPYGTGKTLTARVIAQKATTNKWTFIYLKQAEQIAYALKLAEQYAPAVLFAEDIDQVVSGERDDELNEILNTMDGIDTKDKPVVTIFTTNNPEKIHPGFLRAGRIDSVIHMGAPDEEAAQEFVKVYANDGRLLVPEMDLKPVGVALAGFVPAFISEAVQRAKRRAIHRHGANIDGCVTQEDLLLAADELVKHIKMVNNDKRPSEAEKLQAAINIVFEPVITKVNDMGSLVLRRIDDMS